MSRRFFIVLSVLALALAMLAPVGAAGAATQGAELGTAGAVVRSAYDSYIVVLKADPLVVELGRDNLRSPEARLRAEAMRASHDAVLAAAGLPASDTVHHYVNALNGFSARMSYADATRVAADKNVAMVLPDELYQPTTENSPTFLGLNATGGAWESGYVGEDVVVGVIDTGIWPEHPSFADDGSYSDLGITLDESVYSACDFGNIAQNPGDADFTCNDKLIGARQILDTYRAIIGAEDFEYDSARDDNGHGTHTASTAAGNSDVAASIYGIDRGIVSGIAPRARVIAYKALGFEGGFGSDLAAAIDQAVADGVDVINYSIGGGASLIGPDDLAFLFAADAGVFVAASAGNNGPGSGTIGGPASVPWLTAVGANTQNRTFQGSASSSDGWEYFGASVTPGTAEVGLVDAEAAGDELCNIGALDPNVVTGKIVLCLRGVIARVDKSEAVAQAGGVGMILYNPDDVQALVTDNHFVPSVHVNFSAGSAIKSYIASDPSPTAMINAGVAVPAQGSVMADFSSRGPNPAAADIIKPDVTAPGVNILAGNTPTPDSGSPGELFQSISGTSMSSPHVAGIFALIKQAHPDWTPAMAKSAIMTTARQDVVMEDGVSRTTPFDIGAGHVNPGLPRRNSAFNPGIVYNAGFLEYLGFLCDAAPEVFVDPVGTCDFLAGSGIPTDASDLNLASIAIGDLPGSQTVTRTITSVASTPQTYRVKVTAPKGYQVSVIPSTITLRPGESASYEVTFTNVGAPIGGWRFGSLRWQSARHNAYSPIALRASLFAAPASVTGSGTDGSASFDIRFGYTGAYTAAGHGLEPATVTSDTVVQDPDQTFDPNDGFSDAHQFTLSGAAHFRVVIPPEGVGDPNVDLDVYVFDPNGQLAAASTLGGTNEQVDIANPADGTWTVFVHGWQTVGPDAAYDMSSWVVSATPGGSLSVDSAPASATSGATGTVDISWSGLTAGTDYLGAVSHSDAGGVLGYTLVEVDA